MALLKRSKLTSSGLPFVVARGSVGDTDRRLNTQALSDRSVVQSDTALSHKLPMFQEPDLSFRIMPRSGELSYYERIGAEGRLGAINKPFSKSTANHAHRGRGHPGPASCRCATSPRCGRGTGRSSYFLAKSGYSVVGQDVSAMQSSSTPEPDVPRIVTHPDSLLRFPGVTFTETFDAVVFFDSLHHAIDERGASKAACQALRPRAVVIAAEPGVGHAKSIA